jgi:hypothetical protein
MSAGANLCDVYVALVKVVEHGEDVCRVIRIVRQCLTKRFAVDPGPLHPLLQPSVLAEARPPHTGAPRP